MIQRGVIGVLVVLSVLAGASAAFGETLLTTQVPGLTNVRDGATVNYELGIAFTSVAAGQITGIRFWKASNESGTHTGRIWSASGQPLASVTFAGETASGWQQQNLATPLTIAANTTYVVSVNTGNAYYVATNNGLASQIASGNLRSVVGNNGKFGTTGQFPTNTWQSSNYFRDVVFVAGGATYSMSGTVNPLPAGGSVTIAVTGGGSATTTTNSSGAYSVAGLANGTYTVTPSKTGATFTPPNRTVTVNGGNVTGQNFTVQTYTISGIVSGGGGATVNLTGAASASVTADVAGNYVFSGLLNGNYTVTPSKAGSTFSPTSRAVTISGGDATNVSFTAVYTISGVITGGSGATVTLSGTASGTTTANASGNYSFPGLNDGSYTVAVSKNGFTFTPPSRDVTVSGANLTGVNFVVVAYLISGTINGGGGATVTLSGAASNTVTADGAGNYSFSGVLSGSYTVTPSKAGVTFSPANKAVTVSQADVAGVDFTAIYSISGTVTGGGGATVTLSGDASATVTANGSGNYTFSSVVNGSYTVTPSKPGFTFTPSSQGVAIAGASATGINFSVVTYSISGTITGPSGATVTLSGASSATVTANGSGNYLFSGLLNGDYTITPNKAGFTFSPTNQLVTINGVDVSAINFTAPTYSISGTVSGGGGSTLSLSGPAAASVTADAVGGYSFTGLPSGNFTVTPSGNGFAFSPLSRSANITSASVTGINFTATVSTTITTDVTVFGDRTSKATTVTTSPAFSTTAGNELLLAMIGADVSTSSGTNNSVTSVTGGGLTWVLVRRTNTQRGTAEIWRAFATAPLSNVTVTANLAISAVSSITVMSFRGVNTSGTNGSGAIGNTGTGNGTTGVPTASLVTLGSNSLIVGVGEDWNAAPSVTVGPNQTLIHQMAVTNLNTIWTQRQNATTPTSGTTVTINDTVPTNHVYNMTICEILAASGGSIPTTYSISGTISAAASGATVVLSGAASATVTANSSGSYTFSGLSNGNYTVMPTKSGFTFSPSSTAVTVNNANVTANFTAAAAPTYNISGTISPTAGGANATMAMTGNATASTTTNGAGMYLFSGLTNGGYTLTPSNVGYAFSPINRSVTVNGADVSGMDFTAAAQGTTYSISGTVTSTGSGAVMMLNGAASTTVTASSTGAYTFTNLPAGSYTVTPSKAGVVFTPTNRNITITTANATGVSFTAATFQSNFTVNGSQTFQTMDGTGVNINVNSWNGGELAPALDLLVDTNGAKVFRVIRDPMTWVSSESLISSLHNLNATTLQQVYEAPEMVEIWDTIGYLNQKGIRGNQIVLNFMGWLPTWIGGSGQFGSASHVTAGKEPALATMIASLVYYGRQVRHLDFTGLAPMNEADLDCKEGPCASSSQYVTILRNLVNEMNFMGLTDIRLIAPDTAGTPTSYISAVMGDSTVAPRVDHLTYHAYGTSVTPGASYSGKTYWVTETGASCPSCDSGGTPSQGEWSFARDTTDIVLDDIANGFTSVLIYDAYDSFYFHHNSFGFWGLLAYNQNTHVYTARKRFYANAQVNAFITPGSVRIGQSDSISSLSTVVAFHNPATGKVTIIGQNSGGSSVTINGQLLNLPPVSSLAIYTTSPSANLQRGADVPVNSGTFSVTIPADSFFSLTN